MHLVYTLFLTYELCWLNKPEWEKLKKLPAGSIYSEVKNQNHFAMTGDKAVIVEINGYGPSGVNYVNPADDPKNKKH